MKLNFRIVIIGLLPLLAFSQEERKIENIFENIEIQEGAEEIFNLEELQNLRINLNSADYDNLMKIPFFDFYLASNFLRYRNTYKEIISFEELLEIEGFSEELVEKIKVFSVLDFTEMEVIYFDQNVNNLVIRDKFLIEKREGFLNKKYRGDNHKIFFRYNFLASEYLDFGFSLEKDEGENYKNGIDYYSMYIEIKKITRAFDLYLGDFHAEFGQGFSIWTGYKINKNLNDVSVWSSKGFRAHKGTDENKFMRGFATKIYYKNLNIYIFFSNKKVDSNIENDTVKIFLFTGLHRTENEIINRKNLQKKDFGIVLEYKKNDFNFEIMTIYTKLDKVFFPNYELYKMHSFLGNENFVNSFSYNYKIENLVFFGENGISNNDGFFTYNGFFIHPISEFKFLISHRYLNKKYFTFYSSPFSNYLNSEEGIFFNFLGKPFAKIEFIGYLDFYKNIWLTYNLSSFMWAKDFTIQSIYKINNNYSFSIRFSDKSIPINYLAADSKTQKSAYENNKNFRIEFNIYKNNISLRTRVENTFYKDYKNQNSKGLLLYQNIRFSFPSYEKINFYLRYVLFNSEKWSNRIYAYEDDFTGLFSSNLHYNKGNRYYFMIRYDFLKNIQTWFKISQTIYENQYSIGTANDQIEGNKITEVKFQINIKL